MKYNAKNIISILTTVFLIISCSTDDTSGVSSITYYPQFELLGDETIFVNAAETNGFEDPGVIVTENGKEIDYNTDILGDYQGLDKIDMNVPDRYNINYSAENIDGFSGSISRNVWVYKNGDFQNSIEGIYESTVVRNGSTGPKYTDMKYILIWKNDDGSYEISDAIGGYYEYGRGYGVNYIAKGLKFYTNDVSSNEFEFGENVSVSTFGGVVTPTEFSVDSNSKTIHLITDWDAGYTFDITLKQVNP